MPKLTNTTEATIVLNIDGRVVEVPDGRYTTQEDGSQKFWPGVVEVDDAAWKAAQRSEVIAAYVASKALTVGGAPEKPAPAKDTGAKS